MNYKDIENSVKVECKRFSMLRKDIAVAKKFGLSVDYFISFYRMFEAQTRNGIFEEINDDVIRAMEYKYYEL